MPDMRVYDTIRRFPGAIALSGRYARPPHYRLLLPLLTWYRLVAASGLGVGVAGVVLPLVG